jgi:hypothetical protein
VTPGRRRRRNRLKRLAFLFAILGMAGAVLWYVERGRLADETAKGRELDSAISAWGARSGILPEEPASTLSARQNETHRWLYPERFYWYGPRKSRSRLVGELKAMAASYRLGFRTERGPAGAAVIEMAYADGREAARVTLARQVFVAIVIDDIGYRLDLAKRIAALPCKLTMSVMPFTPHARQCASLALANGKEVMVHMPMEPNYRMANVPEYSIALLRGQTRETVIERVRRGIDAIPGAVGLNNHEGSVGTEDRSIMKAVMEVLKERNLIFLDSWTTPKTTGYKAARSAGVPWARRNVFLDVDATPAGVNKSIDRVIHLARMWGRATAIGHPKYATIEALEKRVPEAQARGVKFVFVSSLVYR